MASVLFSTVGQALGGPLGAGIGAAVGTAFDRSLFRRRGRGAEDGFVSRSAYGETVPMLYGRTRVGGHLIWATMPVSGGQKGQGRRAQSTSFAMAVSRGPIAGIGRIWADGRLLRREDGVFLEDTDFRVHSEGESEPDPLIQAAEGETLAPAYRHLSYVVFEGMDLGPFGNRIPSLSFEVMADDGTALDWLERIAAPLGGQVIGSGGGAAVSGYTAWLEPARDDIAALLAAAGARSANRDGRLAIVVSPGLVDVSLDDIVEEESGADGRDSLRQDPRPSGLGLSFLDSERDFQLGWQQELRGSRGDVTSFSWPLASSASAARAIAARLLEEACAGAEQLTVSLPQQYLTVSVGDRVRFGNGASWVIAGREIRGLAVQLEMRRVASAQSRQDVPSDAGRVLTAPALVAPPTTAVAIEPPVPIMASAGPGSVLVVASGGTGWRGADLFVLQGGEEVPVGTVSQMQPFGVLMAGIGGAPATIWDERTALSVDVSAGSGLFLTRNARDVLDGAGLLSVGEELIQYREAHLTAPGVVRLTGLLRGRFGTRVGEVSAGTLVMALPRTGSASFQTEPDALGREIAILVSGAGDPPGGALLAHRVSGSGWTPLAPAHVRAERLTDGALVCNWVERHRDNWRWESAEPTPAGSYRLHVRTDGGVTRTVAAEVTGLRLEPARQVEMFGFLLGAGDVRVEAIGDGPEAIRFSAWVSF